MQSKEHLIFIYNLRVRRKADIKVGNYNLLGASRDDTSQRLLEIIDLTSAVLFGLVNIAADDRIRGQRKFHFGLFLIITAPTFLLSLSQEILFISKNFRISMDPHVRDTTVLENFIPKAYLPLPYFLGFFVATVFFNLVKRKAK